MSAALNGLSGARAKPGGSLWRYVGKLMRLRLVIFWSGFRRARLGTKIGTVMLFLLILAGMGLAFVLSWLLLRFLRSPQLVQIIGNPQPFLEGIPVLVVTAVFFIILLTSFGVLLQALYLAGDMDFLLAAPIPARAIFLAKLLQAILPNFGLTLLFCLPVLYGLGAAQGYNLLYYPLVLVVLAVLALAAAGLSSLLVMALVRIFPARRVAEVLGFIVATSSFLCSQSGQLARYVDVNVESSGVFQVLDRLSGFDVPWSPLAWAGHGLVSLGRGEWAGGMLLLALSIALAGGIFVLTLSTAEKLYYTGWASMQGTPRKKKVRAARRAGERRFPLLALFERLIPAPVRAIAVKDFLMLRRDLRNLSQLVTPLILGIVYSFMLLRGGGEGALEGGPTGNVLEEIARSAVVYGNVGIAMFVGWSLLSRLAGMAFSAEGKSYWMLKVSPVSAGRMLAAKFLVAYMPTLLLGSFFLVAISLVQGGSPGVLLYSLLVVALCNAGLTGLSLAFGVLGANFEWEDPRKMNAGSAGCVGAVASMVYLLASLGLFFLPPILLLRFEVGESVGQAIGLMLGGLFCLACTILPPLLVQGRIPRLNE